VVQREIHYRHFGTKQKFFLSRANDGCGRAGTAIFLRNESGATGCLRYSKINGEDLVIEHVEAAGGAAKGSGALLVYLATKEAVLAGGTQCYIGMGTRDPRFMNFWTNMGFDMTTVMSSTQPVLLTTVRANAKQRVDADGWQQSVEKKGCFLSTACTAARGLPDDCEELTVLRRFREGFLAGTPEGEALLDEYEILAPRIVAAIDERADALAVYERIYNEIAACVRDIQGQDHAAALDRYSRLVEGLAGETLFYPPR
jgi:AcrR family transcriptional regulator